MDRDWDDMTDAEWEAYEERVYQEQLEEIKQTVRVTLPWVARQIGVMLGVMFCKWGTGAIGFHAPPIPNIGQEAKRYYISERVRRTLQARDLIFVGERVGLAALD
ncbi:Uncharacterized protein PBTT_01783 [Plasmodiophora brassicae]